MQIILSYIILIIIWSTTPLAIQWSTLDTSFSFGVTSRMLIGILVCFLILFLIKQKLIWTKQAIKAYACAAIGIFGAMTMVYWASQYIPSGLIAVIFGLTPLFTAIFEHFYLSKKALSTFKIIGILVAFVGLVVIFYSDLDLYESAIKGIIGVTISTMLHAISAVLTKKYQGSVHSFTITTGGLLFSMPFFIAVWFMVDGSLPNTVSTQATLSILYLAIIATGIGFNLYFYALHKTDASTLALITLVTPVTALLLGLYLNQETVGFPIIAGTALIMLGLFINQQGERFFAINSNTT